MPLAKVITIRCIKYLFCGDEGCAFWFGLYI